MNPYIIERDGLKDLRFGGVIIAEANNRWLAGRQQNRWHELTLYRTAAGNYVLHELYITQWQGELCASNAYVYDNADAVIEKTTDTEGGISALGKTLLKEAAKTDPAFAGAWVEYLK